MEQTRIGDFGSRSLDLSFRRAPGTFVSVSAQSQEEYGSVRVAITVNGAVLQEAESDEPFGIASASGIVP
jgi:hypothetical protein